MTEYSVYFNLNEPSPLIDNIFKIDELKNLYVTYLNTFINDFFNYTNFLEKYNQTKSLYELILIQENHLGNKVFRLRNMEWYFDTKINFIQTEIV